MTGLVIDGSSPAPHFAAGASNAGPPFTPPDSPLILNLWAGDSQGFDPGADPVVSSSPSQTWVTDIYEHANSGAPALDGQAGIWHAVVSGTPGSTVVTIVNQANSPSYDSYLITLVITGYNPGAPIGAAGGGRQSSGSSVSDSYIATISGGQGVMVICDWNAGDVTGWTEISGCKIISKDTNVGKISYAVLRRTDPDGIIGVSTPLGITGLVTGGVYHWAYAEVVSLEAAIAAATSAGYPALGANSPMF
jgi:hypothetical protein